MKKIYILTVAIAFMCLQVSAQPRMKKADRLAATLELNEKDAAKFAELYEEYKQEMLEVKDKFPMCKAGKAGKCKVVAEGENAVRQEKPRLTEEEVEKNLLNRFAQGRAMLDIREKYYHEFRKILSPSQIQKVYSSEMRNAEKMKSSRRKGRK